MTLERRTPLKRGKGLKRTGLKRRSPSQELLETGTLMAQASDEAVRESFRRGGLRARSVLARSWIKRTPSTRVAAYNAEFAGRRPLVHQRSQGRCEIRIPGVCTGTGEEIHHRKPRARGGSNDLRNLEDGCRACHRWCHDVHPEMANALGHLLHASQPETTPVKRIVGTIPRSLPSL